jgi:peptidoglycan/LPS O-acetylase OafA/YrhL
MNQRHIDSLTSLRFLAAVMVVSFHHGQSVFSGGPEWLRNVASGGFVGIPFFFLLSGFVLGLNYSAAAQAGTLEPRRFWLSRFARIYPAYVFSLAVSAPIFFQSATWPSCSGLSLLIASMHVLANLALLQAWIPGWAFSWNGPAWFLSAQAFFYLLFPVCIARCGSMRRRQALAAFVGAAGVLWAIDSLVPSWALVGTFQRKLGWANPLLWLPLFLAGTCLADAHSRHQHGLRGPNLTATGLAALTGVAALCVLTMMAANLQRVSQLLFCYASALPCGATIWLLAQARNPITRLLRLRPLVLLGEASYSLYILHRPLHDWFECLTQRIGFPATTTKFGFSLYLSCCIVGSLLFFRFVEAPCCARLRERLRAGREKKPVAASQTQPWTVGVTQ